MTNMPETFETFLRIWIAENIGSLGSQTDATNLKYINLRKRLEARNILLWARLRSQSRHKVRRTRKEFDSLNRPGIANGLVLTGAGISRLESGAKGVAIRPMRRTIPDEHRDRLIEAGYIRAGAPRWRNHQSPGKRSLTFASFSVASRH
jgi:hypothetical protein